MDVVMVMEMAKTLLGDEPSEGNNASPKRQVRPLGARAEPLAQTRVTAAMTQLAPGSSWGSTYVLSLHLLAPAVWDRGMSSWGHLL